MRAFTLTLSLSLVAAVSAQVPPGYAVHGAFNSPTPLIILDRTVNVSQVTGLTLISNINAVKLDPIDGSVWLGENTTGKIVRITLNGSAVATETIFATHSGASTDGFTVDRDCHLIAAGGTVTTTGGVWKIDRNTGNITQLVSPSSGLTGYANAIDTDPATGDLYLGLFGSGQIQRLSPPAYTPALFTTVSPVNIYGLAVARRPGGNLLFVGVSPASLLAVDINASSTVIPGTPPFVSINWLTYDQQRDDLWLGTGSATRTIYTSTVQGVNRPLHVLPSGTPASLDVNDAGDTTLLVCPQYVPSPLAPITIEHGLSGKPGHIGVIAMVRPFFLVLAVGFLDAGGKISSKLPAIGIPPGTPGRFQFLAATIDPATTFARISNQVDWPAN